MTQVTGRKMTKEMTKATMVAMEAVTEEAMAGGMGAVTENVRLRRDKA